MRRIGLLAVFLAAPGLAMPALAGMGIWTRDLTRSERSRRPGGEPLGTWVGAVYPGSPAAAVGLQTGDRIVSAAGRSITNETALVRALGTLQRTETVSLEISRRGRSFRVDVPRLDNLLDLGGVLLNRGEGQAALAILTDTCVRGHLEACCLTAQVHQKGRGGVPPHVARAAGIYESLCQRGHAHACHDLGFLYRAGNAFMGEEGWRRTRHAPSSSTRKAAPSTTRRAAGRQGSSMSRRTSLVTRSEPGHS